MTKSQFVCRAVGRKSGRRITNSLQRRALAVKSGWLAGDAERRKRSAQAGGRVGIGQWTHHKPEFAVIGLGSVP
jgi:hypothetical protein